MHGHNSLWNFAVHAPTILAQTPYNVNEGESGNSLETVHHIDVMITYEASAILAHIPNKFNGGEICMSIGMLHIMLNISKR
jgi:hypothetical protein